MPDEPDTDTEERQNPGTPASDQAPLYQLYQ